MGGLCLKPACGEMWRGVIPLGKGQEEGMNWVQGRGEERGKEKGKGVLPFAALGRKGRGKWGELSPQSGEGVGREGGLDLGGRRGWVLCVKAEGGGSGSAVWWWRGSVRLLEGLCGDEGQPGRAVRGRGGLGGGGCQGGDGGGKARLGWGRVRRCRTAAPPTARARGPGVTQAAGGSAAPPQCPARLLRPRVPL